MGARELTYLPVTYLPEDAFDNGMVFVSASNSKELLRWLPLNEEVTLKRDVHLRFFDGDRVYLQAGDKVKLVTRGSPASYGTAEITRRSVS